MKEAYAVRRTVPPSAEIEEQIENLFAVGVGENPRESLSELARLGARLIIQRAVEDEFDAWLGRARYERRPGSARQPGDEGSALRNGFRPRKVHTLEGELEVDIPQVRAAAEPFVSKLFPCRTKVLRTEPLRAMVIGAFVRGLSMRDIESLCEKAGLGSLSKATASRICQELRERFEHFKRRDLYDIQVVALFLDAVFLPVRPDGPKEGVLVAWGFTADGERVLLSVMLVMRESHEDWQELGRDLIARALGAPLLVVADGAPGLIKAVEQCWPAARRGAAHVSGMLQAAVLRRAASSAARLSMRSWSVIACHRVARRCPVLRIRPAVSSARRSPSIWFRFPLARSTSAVVVDPPFSDSRRSI
jgi:putative transposase